MDEKNIEIMQKVASRFTREHRIKFMKEHEEEIKKQMERIDKEECESEDAYLAELIKNLY